MHKIRSLFLLLGLFFVSNQAMLLFAQEVPEEEAEEEEEEDSYPGYDDSIQIESDWDGYISDAYTRGDQVFAISVGVIFPLFFTNKHEVIEHKFNPPVGGTGSLAYNYFLTKMFFVGGEIGVKFNYTLGENTVFLIPIGFRLGWQFLANRFEFPISLVIGFAPQRYLNYGYAGLFVKGVTSAYFRFNPDWSFGLNIDWNWYPQWPKKEPGQTTNKNVYGNILGLTLSARYHF